MNRRTFLRALTATAGAVLGLRVAGAPEEPAKPSWNPVMDDSLRPEQLVEVYPYTPCSIIEAECSEPVRPGQLLEVGGDGRLRKARPGSNQVLGQAITVHSGSAEAVRAQVRLRGW